MSRPTSTEIEVWVELDSERWYCHVNSRRGVVSTSFSYANTYLGSPTAYEADRSSWLRALVACAGDFALTPSQAVVILQEVRAAVSSWQEVALRNGIGPGECRRFTDAFTPLAELAVH